MNNHQRHSIIRNCTLSQAQCSLGARPNQIFGRGGLASSLFDGPFKYSSDCIFSLSTNQHRLPGTGLISRLTNDTGLQKAGLLLQGSASTDDFCLKPSREQSKSLQQPWFKLGAILASTFDMSIGSLERVVGSQGPNSMFREPSGLFRPAILLIFVSSREKIPPHARLPETK